ncbi:MAG: diguanylate cyclase [Aquabacterium sp.]|uniref:GGDEF domain-containing protein n=1 Tax=Aquabacterium sp. TaxID=1872578 RepID=UPI0027185997|nr:diguanylate cyclase [Aquabacterium sp.]MDO9005304.1 diguanylate cyclase [Aquabacterium sp.]
MNLKALMRRIELRLLDRNVANRCMVFAVLSLPMGLILWGLQAYALAHPEAGAFYRPGALRLAQLGLTALILWLTAVVLLAWHLRRQGRDARWLAQWTVMPTFIVFLLLAIGHGLKDTPMGMVLIQELVVARALFSLRTLKSTLILVVVMVMASDLLITAGQLGYAPLLTAPVFNGEDLAGWWAVWLRVMFQAAVLPFSAMLFFAFNTLRRQRKELESLVRTDVLTGLSNRREFMSQLEIESHRHARSGRPFCLVVCDVDHFKKVNDSWGHPVGDAVLAQLGRILQSSTRDQIDTAARLGGEEFVLLLPDTHLDGARRVASKIASSLREHVFQADGASFSVTQSIGIAEVHGGQGERALRIADQNLYTAKRAGRDQTVASVVA